jgi:hypothetical protein
MFGLSPLIVAGQAIIAVLFATPQTPKVAQLANVPHIDEDLLPGFRVDWIYNANRSTQAIY